MGEYIIEQFKATSVDQLVTTYKLTADGSYIIDSATGSAYSKNSTKYTGKVSKNSADAALPTGMRKGYTAELTLTPAKNVVNADYAIPVIDNLDKKYVQFSIKILLNMIICTQEHHQEKLLLKLKKVLQSIKLS